MTDVYYFLFYQLGIVVTFIVIYLLNKKATNKIGLQEGLGLSMMWPFVICYHIGNAFVIAFQKIIRINYEQLNRQYKGE